MKEFSKYVGKGYSAKCSQDDDARILLAMFNTAMKDYTELLMPKKVFGGLCSCLKPARSGTVYEKRYFNVRSQLVQAKLGGVAAVIEMKGESLFDDAQSYIKYAKDLNSIQDLLVGIKSNKATDQGREQAKNELTGAVEKIKQFLKAHDKIIEEYYVESQRRVKAAQELLTNSNYTKRSKQGNDVTDRSGAVPISNRTLVKVQSSLQEIMNSAASVSDSKARESLNDISDLEKDLKEENDKCVKHLKVLKQDMLNLGLDDKFDEINNSCVQLNTDAVSKLKSGSKKWKLIKEQSQPRKVVEFVDESSISGVVSSAGSSAVSKFKEIGEKVVHNPTTVPGDMIEGIGGVMKSTFSGAVSGAVTLGKKLTGQETSDNASVSSNGSKTSTTSKNTAAGTSNKKKTVPPSSKKK